MSNQICVNLAKDKYNQSQQFLDLCILDNKYRLSRLALAYCTFDSRLVYDYKSELMYKLEDSDGCDINDDSLLILLGLSFP